jgi:uncharacterized membrane protein YgcG
MEFLNNLTPAESYFLLKDEDASQKELLKLTLIDLLLKNVLRTYESNIEYSDEDNNNPITYVAISDNFWSYQALEHEMIFLSTFKVNNSIQVLFSNMVKIGYKKSISEKKLHKLLTQSPNLKGCYHRNLLQQIFGGYSITENGEKMRAKIKKEVDSLNKELPAIIAENQLSSLEKINLLKGNIFILKDVNYDIFKQFDNELLEQYRISDASFFINSFTGDPTLLFEDLSSVFDSSCSSDSGCSSGDSGWSGGDSGCSSGCSGCGGGD